MKPSIPLRVIILWIINIAIEIAGLIYSRFVSSNVYSISTSKLILWSASSFFYYTSLMTITYLFFNFLYRSKWVNIITIVTLYFLLIISAFHFNSLYQNGFARVLEIAVSIFIACAVLKKLPLLQTNGNFISPQTNNIEPKSEVNELKSEDIDTKKSLSENEKILATNKEISSVIGYLNDRIKDKKVSSAIMLAVIFLIVGCGAYFSIGSVALNEYKNINEIQVAKKNLLDRLYFTEKKYLSETGQGNTDNNLKLAPSDVITDSVSTESPTKMFVDIDSFRNALLVEVEKEQFLIEIKKLRADIKNGLYDDISSVSLEKKLSAVKENKLQWDEIIMRLSLAVLTVFLVQIFFNVYKFFQAQTNYLENKVESLTLFETIDNEEEKKNLRKSLLSKIGSSPSFSKDPSSPVEQVIKMAESVTDRLKK